MNILDIKVLRGPNYWSIYRKNLIVMKLDIGDNENFPTNKIKGFDKAIEKLIPSLREHRCSVGREGGFLQRVHEGTWLGHVVEHVALELQTLAGMDCGFGRTRSTKQKCVYHVVYAYVTERAGIYAGKAAVRIVENIAEGKTYDISEDIEELKRIYNSECLGPSTQAIADEAKRRNIPYTRLNNDSLLMLGQGANQKIICSSLAATTSSIGVDLADNKETTRQLLSASYVPVPEGLVITHEEDLKEATEEIGFPLVVKPINGNHGRGVTTNILNYEQALEAFRDAQEHSYKVIIEKFIQGTDYRFLVVNFKLVAVAKRTPAMVMGDGTSTIQQLIDIVNSDPQRGEGHEKILTRIKVDANTLKILEEKNLNLDSILPLGEILFLKDTANLSSGGTASDVTDSVHPENVFLAERIARLMNLNICGIDILAGDVITLIKQNNGAVLEVNAGPGLRMHLAPSKGLPRNVAEPILDMLYPENTSARIPVVAITGTNGKTTTTRLIAHFAKAAGHNVGYITTDGIYINNTQICHGDCSGPASAAVVLRDPLVDFAVLECARGGILRAGLGFDHCNISVVTNITEDHLGLNDIHTLEDLAKVKSVVPQSTCKDGYAILNADDVLVYAMKKELDCNVAFFSMNAENKHVKKHCSEGGLAAIIEKGYFVICKGAWKTRVIRVEDVPLTFSGTATCMQQNILPSILTAFISKLSAKQIAQALKTFIPSPELTPGRMNIFRFKKFTLMVDYAHNEAGYIELQKYISSVKASLKVGIVSATGDRREIDIRNIGLYAAEIFDEIILKHDRDGRGRTNEELTDLMMAGIRDVKKDLPVTIISGEKEAVQYAIDNAKKGSFIFVTADDIPGILAYVSDALEKENKKIFQKTQVPGPVIAITNVSNPGKI